MQIRSITKEEYQSLIHKRKERNFLQSVCEGNKMEAEGWNVIYVKWINDDTIYAFAKLSLLPIAKFFTYCYIARGIVTDYENVQVLKEITKCLKRFLKKYHCLYMEMDPYIPLQQRDVDGNIVPSGWNHQSIVEHLTQTGFTHLPNQSGYDPTKQCRWISVLDLRHKTYEQIQNECTTHTRRNMKLAHNHHVKVVELNKEELSILHELEQSTSQRQNFHAFPLSYYEQLYHYFGKDHVKTVAASINLKQYKDRLQKEQCDILETIEEAKTKQNKKSICKQKRLLQENQQKLEQIASFDIMDKPVIIAACLYIKYGNEIIYLIGASDYAYRMFRGPYAIHREMIKEAIEEGYDYYNFYGISGKFQKGEEGYGVFDFKRGFHAQVVELIGNFILPVHPLMFQLYQRMKSRT